MLDEENGYRTGAVLAHGFGPSAGEPLYTMLTSDITAAYSEKVASVVRSSVFLNLGDAKVPAALIVYDRVVASKPEFKKIWLLHTIEEPQVDKNRVIVDRTQHGERGRLVLTTLLPDVSNLQLEKVGGRGHEYWVFGENFANDQELGRAERSSQEPGAWRIEVSPVQPAAEDRFLNVMQVTDRIDGSLLPVERVETGPLTGCRIIAQDADWFVLFSVNAQALSQPLSLDLAGKKKIRVLLSGLKEGEWTLNAPGAEPRAIQVSAESRSAWLEGPAGKWSLAPR